MISFYPQVINVTTNNFVFQSYSAYPRYIRSLSYNYLVVINGYSTNVIRFDMCTPIIRGYLSEHQRINITCPTQKISDHLGMMLSGYSIGATANQVIDISGWSYAFLNSYTIWF